LLIGGMLIAWITRPWVAAVVLTYVAVNAVYTLHLKRVPVFDVFCLAGLYTLRIVAGAAAVAVPLSTWLVAFSVFAFLSLALLKRAADIARLDGDELLPGRGYSGRDAAFVNGFGVSTAIAACLVLALYVASDQVAAMYAESLWLWGLVVVVLLWLARMWRMAMNGTMDDDPVLFATRDKVSWGCALSVAICVLLAL
jgi:4-hydroxybenzoate polyprenyltransferase